MKFLKWLFRKRKKEYKIYTSIIEPRIHKEDDPPDYPVRRYPENKESKKDLRDDELRNNKNVNGMDKK